MTETNLQTWATVFVVSVATGMVQWVPLIKNNPQVAAAGTAAGWNRTGIHSANEPGSRGVLDSFWQK